ncbi:MAG: elongation factor G [Alphaproteobacteria bacterium]|nr:elongation factor G [Alphaproteobacteria bacterium]
MADKKPKSPRTAVLVGPYLSGKTTLLEALLAATGAIPRRGTIKDGNTVGDSAPEARQRKMSVELNAAHTKYLDDPWVFIDCPGSIEFAQEAHNALMVADVAIVVCEPVPDRALTVAPILKFLDDHAIPHMLFVNKMDTAAVRVRDLLQALQAVSERPFVLRQVPIRDGDALTGYVDLVSERAYKYKPGQASDLIKVPDSALEREKEARTEMLEALADFDDKLLEQLLEDTQPSTQEIYRQITKDLQKDLIVPVLLGAAEHDHGVRRLLKALRHETPEVPLAAERRGVTGAGEPVLQVFKSIHAAHAGKLTLARVLRGSLKDGATVNGARVSGVSHLMGQALVKHGEAVTGDIVGLGRMDPIKTGDVLTPSGNAPEGLVPWPQPLTPVYALAIKAENRNDEVKLSGALAKMTEEDPSLHVDHSHDTNEMVLWGQGEIHLLVTVERIKSKFNLKLTTSRPKVPYKETIKKSAQQHGRHKRQSGGHGQFGDVHVEIKPLSRGKGFEFIDKIVGGAVPRNFIPSVEEGIVDYLKRGPLGFTVVDVSVTLYDGSYHDVDSSDMAFKTAARIAMTEGMPKCQPVLLEPICQVAISVPNEHTSKVQRVISGRRGQIQGYDAKASWKGWDEVQGQIPQADLHDLIIELRSITQGVGSYTWKFDHLAELTGRLADKVVSDHQAELAAAS